jgi:hypothetical protein
VVPELTVTLPAGIVPVSPEAATVTKIFSASSSPYVMLSFESSSVVLELALAGAGGGLVIWRLTGCEDDGSKVSSPL